MISLRAKQAPVNQHAPHGVLVRYRGLAQTGSLA